MDVSIIIVSYNTQQMLDDCISSIMAHTKDVEYEIIIVDNDSKDETCMMLETKYPRVKLIKSRENLGFGRANNLGMQKAKGKYLFLLNSDTILLNNALKIFFDFAENSQLKIGALGAILKSPDGSNCHSFGKFLTLRGELRDVVAKYLKFLKDDSKFHPKSVDKPMPVDYITGADMWVPQLVYKQLGGFDPSFFMYCEEVDWQRRMSDAGYVRLIINGPEIIHLEGGSDKNKTNIWSATRLKNIQNSKRIYFRKYNHGIKYTLFYFVYKVLWFPILFAIKRKL